MLLQNRHVLKFISIIWLAFFSLNSFSQVLELEESQIQGKKDQPEAMTFVSKASLEDSISINRFDGFAQIRMEIDSDIFNVEISDLIP